jgi:hypothetical protein
MLRRALLRSRSSLALNASRALAPSKARALSTDDDAKAKARAQAEAAAAKKINAGASPLFSWTEVDVSNADRPIPRWQNAAFVVVVGAFFAYFGNKLVTSELSRRERARDAREALETRARDVVIPSRDRDARVSASFEDVPRPSSSVARRSRGGDGPGNKDILSGHQLRGFNRARRRMPRQTRGDHRC